MVYNTCRESTTITNLKVIMVSPIGLNQNNISYQELEVMRRLQSLGINPTGNITTDRQTLQKAEYIKRQNTLAASNTQSLNNLEGTGFAFKDILNNVNTAESSNSNNHTATQQIGATQIAELNRYRLGL